MPRQRLRADGPRLTLIGRLLTLLFGAALAWGGLMVVLLACGVGAGTVEALSGYRAAFSFLAGLTPGDVDGSTRAILAAAGLIAFLLFGWLALKSLPRPRLARHSIDLGESESEDAPPGRLTLGPRALARAAEAAAIGEPGIESATARSGEERIELEVSASDAASLKQQLELAQARVHSALAEHELPDRPVDVTLTGFAPTK